MQQRELLLQELLLQELLLQELLLRELPLRQLVRQQAVLHLVYLVPVQQVFLRLRVLLLQPALAFIWDVVLFDRPTAVLEVVGAMLALVAIYLGSAREKGGKAA